MVNFTFDSDVLRELSQNSPTTFRLIYSSRFLGESTKLSSDGVSVVRGGGTPGASSVSIVIRYPDQFLRTQPPPVGGSPVQSSLTSSTLPPSQHPIRETACAITPTFREDRKARQKSGRARNQTWSLEFPHGPHEMDLQGV